MCSVLANNQPKALRVAVETLGCRSNYADSVSLQAALLERGAVTCGFDSVADVYVLNTCTITDAADREAMKIVRQVRARAPHAKVVLTGCLAQSRRAALEGYPGIDAVVGLSSKSEILSVILGVNDAGGEPDTEPIVQLASLKSPISHQIAGPSRTMGEIATRARYHLRIQDGCRNCCTYCIIPQIKNELSSRSAEDVLDDIRYLASVGYREIVLTGTHLGAYGEERGSSLKGLLSLLAEKSVVRRIRISSLDPNELCPEVIDLIAENEVFCAHLHVCIQSFSDSVLKRMNRRYRMEDVREILWYINNRLPGCCIGSDVITGFPGESRQEVDKAIEEFLGLPISYLHVFPYSERAGTPALRLKDSVPVVERRRRAALWRKHGEARRRDFLRSCAGRELEIIAERAVGGAIYGTSREYAPVKLPLPKGSNNVFAGYPAVGATAIVRAVAFNESEKKLICQLSNPEN